MRLRDQAYDAVIRHMLQRRLVPGQFVSQRELVALTGLPLGAIREMVPRLEADGLLHAIAQRGLQVAPADPGLLRDAYQMRKVIEAAAIERFARSAPDTVLAELRAAHARLVEAAFPDPAAIQAADWAFHEAVVAGMGNGLLSAAHRLLLVRIRLMTPDRTALSMQPVLDEHAVILSALKRRDASSAAAALRRHLRRARQRALGVDSAAEPDRPKRSKKQG